MIATTTDRISTMRARLIIEKGEHAGMIYPLRDAMISIGRGPENTIQVIDPRMSRNHSQLIMREGNWFARDRGSRNGTLVNGRAVSTEWQLKSGDHVQIGDTIFSFEVEVDLTTERGRANPAGTCVRVSGDVEPGVMRQVLSLEVPSHGPATPVSRLIVRSEDTQRLAALYRVMDMMSNLLDLDELLEKVAESLQETLHPDRVGILLHDIEHDLLVPRVIRNALLDRGDIVISNTIIQQAVGKRVAVLVGDAAKDDRFAASDSVASQQIRSAICAPILFKQEMLGVIYLDRRHRSESYEEDDLRLVGGIANQTAIAVANARLHRRLVEQHARERELAIARSIQEHLLPRDMPQPDGFELFGFNRPALMVGGDYYDVISLPDGRLVLAVADVSGKGVPAAILLSGVRTAVQLETRGMRDDRLTEVMERLNQLLCRDSADGMFVTMVLGLLDPVERRFTYCNAGHIYPMLRHQNGRIEMLETGGSLLGVIPGAAFEQMTVELPSGTTLLIYSDGVTDTMNERRECFGMQRLSDLLGVLGNQTAERICRRIDEAALDFSIGSEPFDDFTLLAVRSLRT